MDAHHYSQRAQFSHWKKKVSDLKCFCVKKKKTDFRWMLEKYSLIEKKMAFMTLNLIKKVSQ